MIEKMLVRSLRAIFASGAVISVSGLALTAVAQEKAEKTDKVESVVVTGTRIKSPGAISNSPVSSISAAEIQSAQPAAAEEFFKSLPAAYPAIGPGTNNGTGGAATINLRGLGAQRTLVLMNGRRIVPYDLSGIVDTNVIPLALIQSTEILTGGASVVYGADAVAGVVDFKLKKRFKGMEVNTSYGTSEKSDAKRKRIDVTLGGDLDDGRGNVVLSLGKTKVDPFTQAERPWSLQGIGSTNGLVQGSNTTVPAQVTVAKGTGGTDTLTGAWQVDPSKGLLVQPVGTYNFNPDNYYNTGMDRSQATAFANYRINDNFEAYTEMLYTSSSVTPQLAATGSFATTFDVPIGNPYIPQSMRDQICLRRGISAANCVVGNTTIVPMLIDRRFVEIGPRLNDYTTKNFQYTLGLRGDLYAGWTYDAYFSRGTSDQTSIRRNWGSFLKMKQSLNAVNTTTCVNNTNGCVPLNVWGAAGSINAGMVKFINMDGISLTNISQDVAAFTTTGDLGKTIRSPWAADRPISLSISGEKRTTSASSTSDEGSQSGDLAGAGGANPNRSGSFTMKEIAVEALIPVLRKFRFAENLGLELGYRKTNFSTSAQDRSYNTYKYGGDWEPIKNYRLRGMIQLATRAPNISELFAPTSTGLSNLAQDPCQGALINQAQANSAGTLSNLCRLTGVPVGSIGSLSPPSAAQINRLSGGNPLLAPEEAKSRTLGLAIEPVPRMFLSVDYYKIDITKAITTPAVADILDGCYNPKFNPSYALNASCLSIYRNVNNGTLNGPAAEAKGVAVQLSNLGTINTAGWDFNATYQVLANQLGMDSKWGKLDLGLNLTLVKTNLFQATPASINRDCLGYYSVSCGGPNYKTKFNQRATWRFGDFAFGYNWRHLGEVEIEPLANPLKTDGNYTFKPEYSKIKAFNYIDLNAEWSINKTVKLTVSINNATNLTPPFVGNTVSGTGVNAGNTFPTFYDVIGRYITVGANIKF